ncbi:hypothetical protein V6N13_048948 [Hibiscus sabdariffa]
MNDDKISPPRKKKRGTLDWFVKKSKKNDASSSQVPTCAPSPTQPLTTQAEQEFSSPWHNMPQTQEIGMGSIHSTHPSATFASKERESQLDASSLPHDPTKRKNILTIIQCTKKR